jgi:hypothetical protein
MARDVHVVFHVFAIVGSFPPSPSRPCVADFSPLEM